MEKSAGQVFGDRLGEVLAKRRITKKELADRLAGLDHKLHRVVLGQIEQGGTRARNVSLEDVFAIAYGLGVPPVQLMFPYKEKTLVRIVGAKPPVGATDLYNWITGYAPLDETDPVTYRLELPPAELEQFFRYELPGSPNNRFGAEREPLSPEEHATVIGRIERLERLLHQHAEPEEKP